MVILFILLREFALVLSKIENMQSEKMSIERPTVSQIIIGYSDESDGCRATGSVNILLC